MSATTKPDYKLPGYHPHQQRTPWQELKAEGMPGSQIVSKLGIPRVETRCRGCPPGNRRVSFQTVLDQELGSSD